MSRQAASTDWTWHPDPVFYFTLNAMVVLSSAQYLTSDLSVLSLLDNPDSNSDSSAVAQLGGSNPFSWLRENTVTQS